MRVPCESTCRSSVKCAAADLDVGRVGERRAHHGGEPGRDLLHAQVGAVSADRLLREVRRGTRGNWIVCPISEP